jgi:hypothetical protein
LWEKQSYCWRSKGIKGVRLHPQVVILYLETGNIIQLIRRLVDGSRSVAVSILRSDIADLDARLSFFGHILFLLRLTLELSGGG